MTKNYSKIMMLAVALMASLASFAETKIDGIFYNLDSEKLQAQVTFQQAQVGFDGSATAFSYTGAVTIPQTVSFQGKDYTVTSIGEMAFFENIGLTSVTIPNSVTVIGDKAFNSCRSLTSIEIPSTVVTIGEGAFSGCDGLTSINIPGSVREIGMGAFSACNALTSIVVAKDNEDYDSRGGCNAIILSANNMLVAGCKSTLIPNTVTGIDNCAFYGIQSLSAVTIPNSIKTIGDNAFALCYGISSISIPSSVISVGRGAFMLCNGLTSVEINGRHTSIMSRAFAGCSNIATVRLKTDTPPAIDNTTFSVYSELHIPSVALNEYKVAQYWKKFRIVPYNVKKKK